MKTLSSALETRPMTELDMVYLQYCERFRDGFIPKHGCIHGPLGYVYVPSNKVLSIDELINIFEQFGGPLAVYKECLAKDISWMELLSVREYTKEEWEKKLALNIIY